MTKHAQQYTIRNVRPSVDRVLRKRARDRGTSMNAFLVHVLEKEAGLYGQSTPHDDLDPLIGSWVKDPKVDRALKEQRIVNMKEWETGR